MTEENLSQVVEGIDPDLTELDRYVSYSDGDDVVVCDRENANAWIRSDSAVEREP